MDFPPQGQTNLFGNNGQAVQTPALTQLAQILQSMTPNRQGAQIGNPSQEPFLTTPALSQPSGGNTGLDLPAMVKQATQLQSLPWLSPVQNAASMAGAIGQAGGSSALSSLASLFL